MIVDCRLRIEKSHFPDSGSRIDNRQSTIGNSLEVARWKQIDSVTGAIMSPVREESRS